MRFYQAEQLLLFFYGHRISIDKVIAAVKPINYTGNTRDHERHAILMADDSNYNEHETNRELV